MCKVQGMQEKLAWNYYQNLKNVKYQNWLIIKNITAITQNSKDFKN